MDIRSIVGKYSNMTFGEYFKTHDKISGITKPSEIDNLLDDKNYTPMDIIKESGLYDKKMNNTKTGIKSFVNTDNGDGYYEGDLPFILKDAFNETETEGIGYFALYVINKCIDKHYDKIFTIKILRRCLRAYQSFIQEVDFVNTLEKKYSKYMTIDASEDLDVKEHTDILIIFNGKKYRLWLFNGTKGGFGKAGAKIIGKRNSKNPSEINYIPDGIHFLCPTTLTNTEYSNGWYFYTEKYIQKIIYNIIYYDFSDTDKPNKNTHYNYDYIKKLIKEKQLMNEGDLIVFGKTKQKYYKDFRTSEEREYDRWFNQGKYM